MTLEEFAKKCGFKLIECSYDWGGPIGYMEADHPNSSVCGFRTESAAYKHWFEGKFGKTTGKVVMKLLKGNSK